MKILMLNHEFPPIGGGASPVTLELSRQLVQMGHQVDVVTMHYGKLPKFEVIDGINIYRTFAIRQKAEISHPHELATFLPSGFAKAHSLIRKNSYDILHCHFIIPNGPIAWLLHKTTGIPFIITAHGSDVPGHNPDRFGFAHKLLKPAWRHIVQNAPLVTTPSEFLRQKILKQAPSANVTVIPNGIDIAKFTPSKKTKTILMCSRILKFKGFQYVIEAVKDTELSGWEVDIVGDGPYLPTLKQLAEGSKMPVKFHGWMDRNSEEFRELFGRSAIFVFPSSAESFGMVVAEAMAAGCAIIASDIPAHREVLGDAGLYVQPQNSEQIRGALLTLTADRDTAAKLGCIAANRVVENFSWPSVTQKFVKTYQNVTAKKN